MKIAYGLDPSKVKVTVKRSKDKIAYIFVFLISGSVKWSNVEFVRTRLCVSSLDEPITF